MQRSIDHLVVAVADLDQARRNWKDLGFTVTPVARDPFGTANALVQLDGIFIELLAIADLPSIPEAAVGAFSFAAFNRDFLAKREGASMLALKSADAAADRDEFEKRGLPTFSTADYSRKARGPDGVDREVSFSLSFTREPRLRDVGFFTGQHHRPENFWHPEFQKHANGACRLDSVVLVTRDPADFHAFFTHFTGQHDMSSTSLGVTFDVGQGKIEIMSPIGYNAWYGDLSEPDPRRLLACRIVVDDLSRTRQSFDADGIAYAERMGALVVPPSAANGVALAFAEAGAVQD